MQAAWDKADVYTDELVSATELNRNSGAVLDKAQHGPVTITRNNEAYALIERSKMLSLIKAKRTADTLAHIFEVGTTKLLGRAVPENDPFAWMNSFDSEELGDFFDELKAICGLHDSDSENLTLALDALLHEWRETALALSDPAHRIAFSSHSDTNEEVPLTDPRQ
jgi:prevent-host-death family protein